MYRILSLLLCLWTPALIAGVSTSAPEPLDYHAQLSEFTDLLTVESSGGFRALQNQTLSPALWGGAVLLTDQRPGWIKTTRILRLGLARQGWDTMTPEPSTDTEQVRSRAQALIDSLREAGNRRVLVIALENQAANAIELVKEAGDLRLVMYNASSDTRLTEDLKTQIETLGRALTIELYTRSPDPSEASRRHILAKKNNLATYRARPLLGSPQNPGNLSPAATKRILGAIKTLIIEFEQQKS